LSHWPGVADELARRGLVRSGRLALRDADAWLGTALMTLYRDTRSSECFDALYSTSRAAVERWILSLVRGGAPRLDADELVQETFINVYRYPNAFRPEHPGSFRAWVRAIALNAMRRASTRSGELSLDEVAERRSEIAISNVTPLASVLEGEERETLRAGWLLLLLLTQQALEQLRPRERQALELLECDGLSGIRAAAELQVSRSNFKMIVFRGRRRLAARLCAALLGRAYSAAAQAA
jgi:RNA polymerase sigma factor (sigma-70 family)